VTPMMKAKAMSIARSRASKALVGATLALALLGAPASGATARAAASTRSAGPDVSAGAKGNTAEARSRASSCIELFRKYGTKVDAYLHLQAPAEAEMALEDDADLKGYRRSVEIAYLVARVDRESWDSVSPKARRMLGNLVMSMLRASYPKAKVFLTVFDGEDAIANANWQASAKAPKIEF
jgi:hypothetical protein